MSGLTGQDGIAGTGQAGRSTVLSRAFWTEAADRAVKSAVQAVLLLWAGDAAFDILHADWRVMAGVAGSAAVLSVLTSIVSAPVGKTGTPSVLGR